MVNKAVITDAFKVSPFVRLSGISLALNETSRFTLLSDVTFGFRGGPCLFNIVSADLLEFIEQC